MTDVVQAQLKLLSKFCIICFDLLDYSLWELNIFTTLHLIVMICLCLLAHDRVLKPRRFLNGYVER